MTRRAWLAAALAPLCAARAAARGGCTVTGRFYRVGPRGEQYAAQGVRACLWHATQGQSSPAYSDARGLFAWYGIRPADYVLLVWWSERAAPLTFAVRVPERDYAEIPAIRLP